MVMNQSSETLLIVDDAVDLLRGLKRLIKPELGCRVVLAESAPEALQLLAEERIAVVLSDIRMPDVDGMQLLECIKTQYPETAVILMTAYGSIDQAVDALKKGAYDFVTKPLEEQRLFHTLHNCFEHQRLLQRAATLEAKLHEKEQLALFEGESPPLQKVLATIRKIAKTDLSVLITGESGSGKELAAHTIHALSNRAKRKMIAVNCPAIPEALLESELFGHKKGAFTHATQDHKGLIELAHGSTLFLDEIGDLPRQLQTKLLRALQEKEIKPLGDNRTRILDVRVIASTNQDLQAKIEQGEFREDLYYRLNVVSIRMPSLREIREDIPLLAAHFLKKYVAQSGLPAKALSPGAMRALMDAQWKGNARQLQNAIKRAAALCPVEVIGPEQLDLPDAGVASSAERPEVSAELSYREARERVLGRFTTEFITGLLTKTKGNVSSAAALCGLERQSLQHLMRKYGIRSELFRSES
jgi:DNA-binding NtrC family response regulator